MRFVESSRYKTNAAEIAPDETLTPERGWHRMDVRWLITRATMGSEATVVGRTFFPPGARHDLHRHPNAEEWEFILKGTAIKQIGGESILMRAGEITFTPRNVYHGLVNASETEPLVTLWGYCGASSLEEAGYVTAAEDGVDTASGAPPPEA